MNRPETTQPTAEKCVPCEGGVEKCSPEHVQTRLAALAGWKLTADGARIRKDWLVRNFAAGMDFLVRVGALAEEEGHHPDVHLENYRRLWIEIWTHAVGGLSENDFILAAKIDRLPIDLK